MSKRTLGTVAALAGLLAAAAPAHAGTLVGNPGKESAVIESPGTTSTPRTPPRGDAATTEVAIEKNDTVTFAGDAYDN